MKDYSVQSARWRYASNSMGMVHGYEMVGQTMPRRNIGTETRQRVQPSEIYCMLRQRE